MKEAAKGDKVQVHYTGRLNDGEVFDSSDGREPLEFTAGEGMVIPGFDNAVIGMKEGDKKTVNIPVDEAYGQPIQEAIIQFPLTNFPEGMNPEVGDQLQMNSEDEQVIPVTVTAIEDGMVTLDANHPLAGKDLTFDIELVKVG